ncbi:MAG: PQQ-binding-like beta-propeller repeat protein [Ignavibacteriales bacterium]|nr:MAG: PQQ-binding-like beta-propeller repeat protein [Ignavibacteriales bacterium]
MFTKRLITLVFLLSFSLNAQDYSFAWLTDIHIGAPGAEEDLLSCVQDINKRSTISFVVATGDIAEKGRDAELTKAKEILDQLKVPYYIIPGNHDTKWSESGNTIFKQLWKDDKFYFRKGRTAHIGINSGVYWRGGGGHFTAEDLVWLDSIVNKESKGFELYFYSHHPLDGDVHNWFKAANILRKGNIKAFFWGHGHNNRLKTIHGIPGAMGRSTLKGKTVWGYTIADSYADSIVLYEANGDTTLKRWGMIDKRTSAPLASVDSLQTIAYNANLLWSKEFHSTLSAPLLIYDKKIYAAFYDGTIRCFDANGRLLWTNTAFGTIVSRPAAASNILAVGTAEGELLTYNATTGALIQSIGLEKKITSQFTIINSVYQGEKTLGVVFGTSDGTLYNYDLFFLNLIWENTSAKAMIETRPLFVKDRILYGAWDNYLYCVDAATGTLNWRWTENQNFYYSPAAAVPVTDGNAVYISVPDKHVSAIDLMLGKTIWRNKSFDAWESIGISQDGKRVFIKATHNKFFMADAATGKMIMESDMKSGLDTMPVELMEYDGKVLFTGKHGVIYMADHLKKETLPVLYAGTARAHTVQQISPGVFAASNIDGKILVFSLR